MTKTLAQIGGAARISPLAAMMSLGEATAAEAVARAIAAGDPTPLEAAIVEAAEHASFGFLDGFAHHLAAAHLAALQRVQQLAGGGEMRLVE